MPRRGVSPALAGKGVHCVDLESCLSTTSSMEESNSAQLSL